MTYATRKALRHSARQAAGFCALIVGLTILAVVSAQAMPPW